MCIVCSCIVNATQRNTQTHTKIHKKYVESIVVIEYRTKGLKTSGKTNISPEILMMEKHYFWHRIKSGMYEYVWIYLK